jgi:1,4-dihydroxy-2-naphthoate octaprenyltransferase
MEVLRVPFEDTKAAAKRLGGTLNTAFLTAAAEAAGRYHRDLGAPVDTLRASMAHAAANVLNDYHDARNGADAANPAPLSPFTGGSRLIQNGEVSMTDARQLAWGLLTLVALGGLWLAVNSGGGLLLVGAMGLLLGWAYSAPPLALMTRGLGEFTVAGVWWLMVVGADYVQRGQFFVIPASLALSYALLVANILLVNGLPDAVSDAKVGKRTLAVRLGPRLAAWLYLLLALLAHGWLALSAGLLIPPMQALWGLVSLPLSLVAAALVWQRCESPHTLRPAIVLTIAATVVHGLGMTVGLLLVGR